VCTVFISEFYLLHTIPTQPVTEICTCRIWFKRVEGHHQFAVAAERNPASLLLLLLLLLHVGQFRLYTGRGKPLPELEPVGKRQGWSSVAAAAAEGLDLATTRSVSESLVRRLELPVPRGCM
jgi:hypothetical protein